MYFPYFIYGLKNEQPDESTIKLALGKHRFYSKLLYQEKYNSVIDKDYLFIYVPNHPENIIEMIPKDLNFRYYLVAKNGMQVEERRFYNQKTLMNYFDITGGILSNFLINSDIPANPILNDKKLFEQFINTPLDKNNILFTTYLEIKNNFEAQKALKEV